MRGLDRKETHLDEVEDSAGRKLMKTTATPSPASIEPLAFGSNAVPPCRLAPSTIADEGRRPSRSAYSVFHPIGMFFSGLADSSPYQEISSAREISIIFTANGPLIYRWESHKLILQIKDTGSGIPTPRLVKSEGIELGRMWKRTAHIGAKLVIQTGPSRGTRIIVTIPISL